MKNNNYLDGMTTEQEQMMQSSFVELMMANPVRWGSTEWDLVIIETGEVQFSHNTWDVVEGEIESSSTPLYGFDTDGWFDYDDYDESYTVIQDSPEETKEETRNNWMGSEMFSIRNIKSMFRTEDY